MEPVTTAQFLNQIPAAFEEGDPDVAAKRLEAENVRLLHQFYAAIVQGDFEAACNLIAEDTVLEILGPSDIPFVGRWQGRDQIRETLPRNFAPLADQKPELQSVVAQGDTVIVVAREQGRYRATGRTYDVYVMHLFRFRAGEIVLMREFFDSAPMLEATRS